MTEIYTLIHVKHICLKDNWIQVYFKTELCRIGIFGGKTKTYTFISL